MPVEEIRILCKFCIEEYCFKKTDEAPLPAVTIYNGDAYCWIHFVVNAALSEKVEVKMDKTTYPPSYSIIRRNEV